MVTGEMRHVACFSPKRLSLKHAMSSMMISDMSGSDSGGCKRSQTYT